MYDGGTRTAVRLAQTESAVLGKSIRAPVAGRVAKAGGTWQCLIIIVVILIVLGLRIAQLEQSGLQF